jgi:hypothetical protein
VSKQEIERRLRALERSTARPKSGTQLLIETLSGQQRPQRQQHPAAAALNEGAGGDVWQALAERLLTDEESRERLLAALAASVEAKQEAAAHIRAELERRAAAAGEVSSE